MKDKEFWDFVNVTYYCRDWASGHKFLSTKKIQKVKQIYYGTTTSQNTCN